MQLGEKILECRKKKGLSQEELGEKINVTRQTISNWELGETSPNTEQLKLLSKEFNISIDELLDNDIKNVLVEKVSNTEKLGGLILKLVKVLFIGIPIGILVIFVLLISIRIVIKSKDTGREIEESIYCKIYGEEHGYNIVYEELTGRPIAEGGDPYFSDILDLDKYNDAHQIFNVINDYVKRNGGSCRMIEERDLNDIVHIEIKEGTLTKNSATVIISENDDYDIIYGESFWIEKYNYKTSSYEKLTMSGDNCGFNMPAYGVSPDKPLELYQDWSCMYGSLSKGIYRLVKDVDFTSDIPIDDNDRFFVWVEFEIE